MDKNAIAAKEASLQISGMTCAACANRIEKGLQKLPGVTTAAVNFALETAHVEFNPADISIADMQKKVEQLGYKAQMKQAEEDAQQARHEEIVRQKADYFGHPVASAALVNGESLLLHFMDLAA